MKRTLYFLFLVLGSPLVAWGQGTPPNQESQTLAAVSGIVVLEGQPVKGAVVALLKDDFFLNVIARVKTDENGRFKLSGINGGAYRVLVLAGAAVSEKGLSEKPGFPISLASGDFIDNFEIKLQKGAVISGRVLDSEKNPVAGRMISVLKIQKDAENGEETAVDFSAVFFSPPDKFQTDDRGRFRVFGLPPGRYLIGVGDITIQSVGRRVAVEGNEAIAFHPKGEDWRQATPIELGVGEEKNDKDIQIGASGDSFSISGQTIDDSSGESVPRIRLQVSRTANQSDSPLNAVSDSKGNFKFPQVKSGEYRIFSVATEDQSDRFSDSVTVLVEGRDASDVLVRIKRGVTVAGRVEVEGATSPVSTEGLTVGFYTNPLPGGVPNFKGARLSGDGTFTFSGVRPGDYRFNLIQPGETGTPYRIVGIRRAGSEFATPEINIGNEPVSDIRLIARPARGTVRGILRVVGGTAFPKGRFFVNLDPVQVPGGNGGGGEVDASGRFSIQGLLSGPHSIQVLFQRNGDSQARQITEFNPSVISVGETGETILTLTVNPTGPNQ